MLASPRHLNTFLRDTHNSRKNHSLKDKSSIIRSKTPCIYKICSFSLVSIHEVLLALLMHIFTQRHFKNKQMKSKLHIEKNKNNKKIQYENSVTHVILYYIVYETLHIFPVALTISLSYERKNPVSINL